MLYPDIERDKLIKRLFAHFSTRRGGGAFSGRGYTQDDIDYILEQSNDFITWCLHAGYDDIIARLATRHTEG